MSSSRIKVAGYAQAVQYIDGIQYRNFTPDLVGQQFANNGGTSLFTLGNFYISTNIDPALSRLFVTSRFSNFITLSDLNLTLPQTQTLLNNNASVVLNLDKSNMDNYALFGSLTEFVRVSLEDIISNWPASLYLTPLAQTLEGFMVTGNTAQNYIYNSVTNNSSFRIDTTFITNKYQITYTQNGVIQNIFSGTTTNSLRNFTVNYPFYVVSINGTDYPVLSYTASTHQTNDYAYISVAGDPFSGATNSTAKYHIKPSKSLFDQFFNSLPDFEYYLLNRQVIPQYTASFSYPLVSDDGVIINTTKSVTWPVSDGYNIDFDTDAYFDYASSLLEITSDKDLIESNLMGRFLVSESITAFDTQPVYFSTEDQDTSGQKVNKLLQLYGVEFDKINNYITGLEFANTVSYDKQNNMPDLYLKDLARVLGWELISSVVENDLLSNYVRTSQSMYSGHTAGLTPLEADIELWRRIILNSPWLWKSKGARKSVEFLLKFLGIPTGLVQFNEYIYKANAPIDIDLFKQVLGLNGLSDDITPYPIDSNGYPYFSGNSNDMYFQSYGLWYRETGGTGSTLDVLGGNNPHLGPYDGGSAYINQFRCLIPQFSAVTISSVTTTYDIMNLYLNYDAGTFDGSGVTTATTVTTVEITDESGADIQNCVVFTPSIIENPNPSSDYTDCGCENQTKNLALSLCLNSTKGFKPVCSDNLASITDNRIIGMYDFNYYQFNMDGSIFRDIIGNPIYNTSIYGSIECCKAKGGTPFLINDYDNGVVVNSGYVCCDNTGKCGCTVTCGWVPAPFYATVPTGQTQSLYLVFIKPDNSLSVVSPDGCNCNVSNNGIIYTFKGPLITDPFTGQIGYGCQLTPNGLADLDANAPTPTNSFIYRSYLGHNFKCNPPHILPFRG